MPSLLVCGAINWDTSCFVEQMPVPGEEVIIKHITRVSGGTGGNVAVAAARILGAGEVTLIGALGEDDIARQQIAALNAEGVITDGVIHISGEESGQAYILVDRKGQNVIASFLGANARLCLEYINKAYIKQQLQECHAIVLTDPSLELATELIKLAKGRGIPVLWDPGILISPNRDLLQSLALQVDVLFLNETEAAALLGAGELDENVQRLRSLGFRNYTVLKLGAQGAVILEPDTVMIVEVPALPLRELGMGVINTVGCGDVFAGAFAAYRALGDDIQKSFIKASAAAGLNATRPETRGCPERASIEEIEQRSHELGFTVRERKLFGN